MHLDSDISFFAQCDWRDDNRVFGYRQDQRAFGTLILGQSGTGKSNLIRTLAKADFASGRGVFLADIHGDLVRNLHEEFPDKRKNDLIYFDVTNPNMTWGFNPLKKVDPSFRHLVTSHIIESFSLLWGQQSWGVKLEHILRNVLLTLLDQTNAHLGHVIRILNDRSFRNQCFANIRSTEVRDFWTLEFPKFTKTDILPVLNKVGSFVNIPSLRRILIENKNQISISDIMNNQKVLLVNLSKGSIGYDAARLLGSLLISTISSSAYHRALIPENERKPFYVYIDEFSNYANSNKGLVNSFAEHRKFKLGYIIAIQFISQIPKDIRDSIFGNIGTIICFRISYMDAKFMTQVFYPEFSPHDFVSLENYHIYLRLMIDGKPSKPFSARTIKL